MNKRITRTIVLLTFLIIGTVLIVLSQTIADEHLLVSLTFYLIAGATFVGALLDPHVNKGVRYTLLILSVIYVGLGLLGAFAQNISLEIEIYCIILGSIDLFKGLVKISESIGMLKEKNKMGILFIIDALIEVTLGILMIIEMNETLRIHVILIGIDALYEGTIKFFNEIVEERLEEKKV